MYIHTVKSLTLKIILMLLLLIAKLKLSIVREPCSDMDAIRLTQFANETMGRLEVCSNGRWGSVCGKGSGATKRIATVACRQLNHAANGILYLLIIIIMHNF